MSYYVRLYYALPQGNVNMVVMKAASFCGGLLNKPGMTAVTIWPYADLKTEVLDSLLSIPTHTLAVAYKDKLSNKRQFLDT